MAAMRNMIYMKCSFVVFYFNFCSRHIVSYGLSRCVIWAVILLPRVGIIQRPNGFNTRKCWATFSKENVCHVVWKIINPIQILKEVQSWRNLFIPGWNKFCFIIIVFTEGIFGLLLLSVIWLDFVYHSCNVIRSRHL
jgi:hypothetical protein